MAGVKTGGARKRGHMEWYLKNSDEKVIRVVVPKAYGQSYWATRKGEEYTRVEMRDMELR